jgi:hypothetical protein
MNLLPNQNFVSNDDLKDVESPESDIFRNSISKISNNKIKDDISEGSSEVGTNQQAVLELLQKYHDVPITTHVPRFSSDPFKLDLIPEADLLLSNLDLTIDFKRNIVSRGTIKFEKEFVYDAESVYKFKRAVLGKDGFLQDESNYFLMQDNILSMGTKCVMLRNSRVILFERNVNLEYQIVQRILSAGILLLTDKITRSELASFIKSKLPSGQFEVSIKYKSRTYVLIGIEGPVFSF